jgi:hypothetical protein
LLEGFPHHILGQLRTSKGPALLQPVTELLAFVSQPIPHSVGKCGESRARAFSSKSLELFEYGLWPVLDKLKIKRAGMHAFRHCHASLLLDVGANPTVTKDQMRHSDARITLGIYGHVIDNSQRDAVNKVGEILLPKNAGLCAQMRPN